MWTATKSRHFKDHGADFAAKNAVDYVRQAKDFLQNRTLECFRRRVQTAT
jgi:pyocin large subunit-like protein